MAVVTHLGVNKWALRQPRGIANDLSIDEKSIRIVLKEFKGLFRQSAKTSRDHNDNFYSLHLRHSRQSTTENPDVERAALDAEYLFPLLKFVSEKAAQQSQQQTSFKLAALTSLVSLLVAGASLYVAFHK